MSTRSLGLRLVRSLTGQIDGDIEFHNDHPGTEAQLSFPMKNGHERREPMLCARILVAEDESLIA
jgi:two-component sensor histidine kinase